jgi:hypothetical protein
MSKHKYELKPDSEPLRSPWGSVDIYCPICAKPVGDITEKEDGGFWVACWHCDDEMSRGDWAREVAALEGTTAVELLRDPLRYLCDYIVNHMIREHARSQAGRKSREDAAS